MRFLITVLGLTSASGAVAQISCIAPIMAVPVASPLGLAGLAVLLAVVGVRILRNRR